MSAASPSPAPAFSRPFAPASDTESLRLSLAHHRSALERALVMCRNSLRTASPDPEHWRDDMQQLASALERDLAT